MGDSPAGLSEWGSAGASRVDGPPWWGGLGGFGLPEPSPSFHLAPGQTGPWRHAPEDLGGGPAAGFSVAPSGCGIRGGPLGRDAPGSADVDFGTYPNAQSRLSRADEHDVVMAKDAARARLRVELVLAWIAVIFGCRAHLALPDREDALIASSFVGTYGSCTVGLPAKRVGVEVRFSSTCHFNVVRAAEGSARLDASLVWPSQGSWEYQRGLGREHDVVVLRADGESLRLSVRFVSKRRVLLHPAAVSAWDEGRETPAEGILVLIPDLLTW